MACSHMNSLPDELLIAIFWPSKRIFSREPFDEVVWASVRPPSRFIREDPDEACYQQSDTMFPAPPLPPEFADAAYNLLLASICRRWRRLAQRHVSTLLVKKDRAVSRDDLAAAVACFPHLTHLHLSDGSAQPIDDAFLAHLAARCPKLTAFHLGSYIVQQNLKNSNYDSPGEYDPAGKGLVTPAGFDAFFRCCTQLEHLSLGCLHSNFGLPTSLFQLVHLRSLAVADLSSILTAHVEKFTSLTALAINTSVWDFDDLEHLAILPHLASLSITEEISFSQPSSRSPPFSFARLPSLTSLDLGFSPCPPFDRMFPADSPCSLLERLSLYQCSDLHALPDDMGERLPCVRELSISMCITLLEQPDQLTSLTALRSLTLAECAFRGLPDRFGHMPALTTLVLHNLNISFHFPASFTRLQSLDTLVVTDCATLAELPDGLGALTALKRLCVAECPSVVLPAHVGQLTNLHSLLLKSCTAPRLLPPSFTQLASLARLELHECDLTELPHVVGEMRRLRELSLLSCPRIQKLPESVAALLRLESLVVDECSSLFSVPTSLVNLTRLKQLELTGCALLRRAPECLPGSLETLRLGSYQQVIHLPGTYALPRLTTVRFTNVIFPTDLSRSSLSSPEHLRLMLACEGEFPFPLAGLPRLRTLTLISTGVVRLPEFSRSTLQELRRLAILMPELTEIPATIGALQKLTYLEIKAPKLPSLPDSIGALSRLGKLILSNSPALTHLPATLTQLACLRELLVRKAAITALPANFARLSRLQVLNLEGCKQLEALPEDVGELKLLDRLISEGDAK
ncbi:unnamed protein product [Closterium sp. Naga37s-1]|nr:unnamed protein product [Closterium sp. Naga37s-1]